MSILNKLLVLFTSPKKVILFFGTKGIFNILPDIPYIKLIYYCRIGKKLNLKDPRTYNEKLQWLKLNDRRKEMIQYVDKYEVREYVSRAIGEQYLVPLFGVYNNFNEIDFSELPNSFVLKCTHDSGGIFICKDKSKINIRTVKRLMNKSLRRKYFYYGREWPYKYVIPKITCEEFLQDNITDYKFFCFNGVPKVIQIHKNRNTPQHTIDFYDTEWNKTDIKRKKGDSSELVPKPECLEEMLTIAKKLSRNEIHVRVDLYEVNGKVYFGEKTYYSASGFEQFVDDKHDFLLGSWINIENI